MSQLLHKYIFITISFQNINKLELHTYATIINVRGHNSCYLSTSTNNFQAFTYLWKRCSDITTNH